jgi:carboxylesterase
MEKKVKEILKTAKGVLFADPGLLYKEEVALTDKSFHFQGSNGKAVLLIHGWTSTAYEVRRLGKYLNEQGYTVAGPMLRGHGTFPKNLEGVRWTDWLEDLEKIYGELRENHCEVFVGGTSIGANLAILLAEKKPEISGIILMATPYKMKLEWLIVRLAKLNLLFKKYNRKFYPPTFGVSTTITRLIAYKTYPIASALESFDLIKEARRNLSKIKQPCFIIQSLSDHVVAKNSIDKIYAEIGSSIKEKKYIKRAYHTFISDIKNESVFEDILKFINEIKKS